MDNTEFMRQLEEMVKFSEEYIQSSEYLEKYKPIENQWSSTDFEIILNTDLLDKIAKKMKDFDFFEKHDFSKSYAEYETKFVTFYNPVDKTANYYVGCNEQFTKEDIEKAKLFCPCDICNSSWWNLTTIFACPGCYGCVRCDDCFCVGHPDYKKNLKKAIIIMRSSQFISKPHNVGRLSFFLKN